VRAACALLLDHVHRRAYRAPADAVARLRQATERAFKPATPGSTFSAGISQSFIASPDVNGRTQRKLAVHIPGLQAFGAFFHEEAANLVVLALRPYQRDVRDRSLVIHIFSPLRM